MSRTSASSTSCCPRLGRFVVGVSRRGVELPTSCCLEPGERRLVFDGLAVAAALDGEAEGVENGEEGAGCMRVGLSIYLAGKTAGKFECCDVSDL
jgi:hypothetical protein